jgi:hypothetical protein
MKDICQVHNKEERRYEKMRKQRTTILALAICSALGAAGLLLSGLVGAGDLDPSAAPGPTMKTLDEIPPTWSQILPASERFKLVMGGEAVLDKETGLVWAKDGNLPGGTRKWQTAVDYCRSNVSIGNRKGWRLPTIEELASLIDTTQASPALPSGHPFENVQSSSAYWSSTTYEDDSRDAWAVHMSNGDVYNVDKPDFYCVWPVRGGK